ncbi:TetR/AcrR family transcriptional regulator [Virgibacillus sp. NKC19-3]|uniref:TetR/AcrR family transcriptional regulator n=1 Tax=Virgibacillus saliphilus TaxID=2831674 RepID=UPI001C9B22F0|nr:TetR/AcrR family transcriptional regulator [Virgibacillus sp. NKC19-3]MBY7141749.1 TetR/AcrR family transcriptional regulator [Virgibacillus sp. NKC19-3]
MKRISKEPDVRRQELMDIGLEFYMKGGIKGFSIKDVVNRAGVATGLFYYYFTSKEAFVDEILNDFIVNNIEKIQQILDSDKLTVIQKITESLQTFWAFVEKLAPYKNTDAFQTEQHFQLEQKLFLQIQPLIQKVIEDGIKTGIFNTDNPILASEFILYGLSSIAHSNKLDLNDAVKKETIHLVLTILKYNQKADI